MANNFLTPSIIAKEVLMHLENDLVIANKVHLDFSDEFVKKGDTINVRRPQRFLGQTDNLDLSAYNEDIIDANTTLAMNKTVSIKFSIASIDRTLDVASDRIQQHYIQPAVTRMKDVVETALGGLYAQVWNFVGTPGTLPSTFLDVGAAATKLTWAAAPQDGRTGVHNPNTAMSLANLVKTTFTDSSASAALRAATIGDIAGFSNYQSVHVPVHTVGAHGGTPLVNGGAQATTYAASGATNSQSLVTDGWTNSVTGILKAGDVITIAGVFAINPVSKQSSGALQDFVVLADANSGASTGPATLTIAPAIITSGAFQTVSAAPADNAVITVKTGTAGSARPQSIMFHRNAFALVTRPLEIPDTLKTKTVSGNKMAISVTQDGDFNTLTDRWRLDMLFGVKALYPDLACRMTA